MHSFALCYLVLCCVVLYLCSLTLQVLNALESPQPLTPPSSHGRKRKRDSNLVYSPEKRAKIAKYAIDHGVMNAHRKFNVPESTVRNFKSAYNFKVHLEKCDEPLELSV